METLNFFYNRFFKRLSVTIKIIALCLSIVILSTCKKEDPPKDPDQVFIEYQTNQGIIGSAGGSITVSDPNSEMLGAGVYIPESALEGATTISFTINKNIVAPTDSTAIVISFKPEGLKFEKPIIIMLPYKGSGSPEAYYYNIDSSLVERLIITEYDINARIVKTETSHFSDFYAGDDGVYADIKLYNVNGKAKCKIQFGGKHDGIRYKLGGIPLKLAPIILGGIQYWNAMGFLEKAMPLGALNDQCFATLQVSLRQDQLIGSSLIGACEYGIRRRGQSQGGFSAEIYKLGDVGSMFATGILDRQSIDIFFSGEALIVDFNEPLESGKKYFIEASWVLSDNGGGNTGLLGTRWTDKYTVTTKTKDGGTWTLSDMLTQDPDLNNNNIFDEYDNYEKTIPTVYTGDAISNTYNSAFVQGIVQKDGNSPVTARGVYYGTNPNPENGGIKIQIGTGVGSFSTTITGLMSSTTYYVKAFATNSVGTAFGSQVSFTTSQSVTLPTVTTSAVTNITQSSATGGGNVTAAGGATVTARGIAYGTSQNPTISGSTVSAGSGTGSFTANMSSLSSNTTYYVRAYATNSAGTAYGSQVSFTTSQSVTLPTVTTSTVTNITQNSATGGGNVTATGGATVTARGIAYGTTQNPTISGSTVSAGSGTGSFTANMSSLSSNTTYYVRAYATNSAGTAYGSQVSFTTTSGGTGGFNEVYNPATGKTWMDRNLGATRVATSSNDAEAYGDLYQWGRGSDGHQVRTSGTTTNLSNSDTPGHSNYIVTTKSPYDWRSPQNDNLWQGVNGVNNPCPSGYRLPTEAEWDAERLSWSSNDAAGAFASHLKLPIAGRRSGGSLYGVDSFGFYWSSTVGGTDSRYMVFSSSDAGMSIYYRASGYSVRCLQDNGSSIPYVTTSSITNITTTSATGGGNVTADGGSAVTARGVCWDTSQNPTIAGNRTTNGTGTGSFSSNLIGLNPNTTYYVRAYATNSAGTAYGSQMSFTTNQAVTLPTVTTSTVTNITQNSATGGGNVTATGGATVTSRGIAYGASQNPTISGSTVSAGSGTGSFTANMSGLSPNTTYYVRAYATNSAGTGYGSQVIFTTTSGGTGGFNEVYNPATGKTWMDRNLGASRVATSSTDAEAYGDLYQWGRGSDGHQVRTSGTTTTLSSSDTPGHSSFIRVGIANSPNDWRSPQNDNLWQGVNGVNNPCPSGYRLPTEAEWDAERLSWSSNNSAGAFASPLKLPAAGGRDASNASLYMEGVRLEYWSSTVDGIYSRYLYFTGMIRDGRAGGHSVRCIKDY